MASKQICIVVDLDSNGLILDYNVLNVTQDQLDQMGLMRTNDVQKITQCPNCCYELNVSLYQSQTEIKQEVFHQDEFKYSIDTKEEVFEIQALEEYENNDDPAFYEDAPNDSGNGEEEQELSLESGKKKLKKSNNKKQLRSKRSSRIKSGQKSIKILQPEEENSKQQSDGTYLCLLCNKTLPTKIGLVTHQYYCKKRPTKEDLTCTECNKSFALISTLRVHIQRCHTEKTYCCHLCGSSFCKSNELEEHLIRHENPKPYQCDLCQERYAVKNSLRDHMKTYHIETNAGYYCKLCNNSKRYPTEHKLQDHCKRVHSGDDRYACSLCPRRFKYPESLRNHLARQHTPAELMKWYPCTQCNFRGPSSKALEKHKIIHLEDAEKPFKCSYCSKGFGRRYEWNRHEMIHRDEKPFICGICSHMVRTNYLLQKHMRIHQEGRPYSCTLCEKRYRDRDTYKKHMKAHASQMEAQGETLNLEAAMQHTMNIHKTVPIPSQSLPIILTVPPQATSAPITEIIQVAPVMTQPVVMPNVTQSQHGAIIVSASEMDEEYELVK